ncbi:putative tyrosine-protein kinase in cps region [bacterium BMS3Abin03]|nr:putative tyrosine-protein kinase in cps region [bacterium BMS3Abin03]
MSFHDIIHTILTNIGILLKVTIVSVILIFLILLFIYPVTYESEVSVLPPEKGNETSALTNLLGDRSLSGFFSFGMQSANSQLFIEILKSRTAALYVVRKLNLTRYFGKENEIDAAYYLSKKLNTDLTKEGIIKLNVDVSSGLIPSLFDDKDSLKNLSALLSNTYIEALDSINKAKLTSKAKRARQYIEVQLKKTKTLLDSVELRLMKFQEENKTIALPQQVSAAIDAAAKLKTEIIQTEIELGFLETNLRKDNQTIISLKNKLRELRQQYDKMQLGSKDYLLAFSDVPELGKKLSDLLRDVKIQNEVYLLLQQQYYKEKIQENRDIPTVEILDEALPPARASSPRVIFSTFLSGVFVFLLFSIIIIVKEEKNIKLQNQVKDN